MMAIFRRAVVSLLLFSLGAIAKETKSGKNISGPVIGIDLGTTFSCVAVAKKTGIEIIPNAQGNRITPSYVGFTKSGRLLGEAAKNDAAERPKQTIFDIKRLIGRRLSDASVQEDIASLPYKVVEEDDKLKVVVAAMGEIKELTPEEISAMILTSMKETAETFLGEEVKHAVITVPAYFNNAQREATKDAGAIAGLDVLRIINEPTAAAIAYGLDKKEETNILVYDLGGGTFDVSLLNVAGGVIEVLATNGDTHLGGEDFDLRVVEHLKQVFEEKHKKVISDNKKALSKLKQAAEKAKIALSSAKETVVEIEGLANGIDFIETLTRAKFEDLNKDLFKKTLEPLKTVLEDAKLQKGQIHELVTVGGSSRIPKIQSMLKSFFNGKELNHRLNPDEAVAYGAAVQAGVLAGVTADEVVLLDITPISLGLETAGRLFEKIIPRNSALPVKKTKSYVTSEPGQTETRITVFEGERRMVVQNNQLGEFKLYGFPEKYEPIPHEVTFEVDANGILTVSAKITSSGKEKSMTISKDKQRLDSAEIAEMIKDAEKFAEQDRKAEEAAQKQVELAKWKKGTEYKIKKVRNKMSEEDQKVVDAGLTDAIALQNYEAPDGVEAKIADPDSKRPHDWDDEEDGEWEPAMIDNPELKDITGLLSKIKEKVDPILAKYPLDESDKKEADSEADSKADSDDSDLDDLDASDDDSEDSDLDDLEQVLKDEKAEEDL